MGIEKQEINDLEKEYFIELVDRLDRCLIIDDPRLEAPGGQEADEAPGILVERGATFALGGIIIQVDTSESIDGSNELQAKKCAVATLQSVVVGAIQLTIEQSYAVCWSAGISPEEGPCWATEFDKTETERQQGHGAGVQRLQSDYEKDFRAFWQSSPTLEQKEARWAATATEELESSPEVAYEYRLTRSRFRKLVPLLRQLGPDLLIED